MALAHIQKRIKQAELPFAGEFNEVLTAAYMEKQKMAVSHKYQSMSVG